MISIDGTYLYRKFKDKMIIATGVDAKNGIYPLAYAIVNEETTGSWSWFLFRFRTYVAQDRNGICLISNRNWLRTYVAQDRNGIRLISDRHLGILNAIADESIGWSPSRAYHRYYLRHICNNFNTHFKNAQLKRAVWQVRSTH